MKVCSWNMYCYNKHLDEVLGFLRATDADIVCLQEVPDTLFRKLTVPGMHIAHAIDSEPLKQKKVPTNYNVILSRFPIRADRAIPLPEIVNPRRTRAVIRIMR